MWPFKKKKIKETKHYPYRGRLESSNYSVWDNMSIIEKFAFIGCPIMLTFIDYFITEALFGLGHWITLAIATSSTIVIICGIWLLVTWLGDDRY